MLGWRARARRRRASRFVRSPMDRACNRKAVEQVALCGSFEEHAEPLVEYADDPVGFFSDVLGVTAWQAQIDIALAVRDNPRVSVAACYASGKTFTAACLVLWWLMSRRPAMVMTTAPTDRQVKTLLWREIRKLFKRARRKLPGRLLQKKLELSDDWWGMGFASDDPNRVAGLHEAKNVLFIEDEAAGMAAEVVEGFEGLTATEGSRHLKIGNPICDSGPFFDSHQHPEESERWVRINIDAEDTPNVQAGHQVVPGLVSREWVEDKRRKWLERGLMALWETRVKGRFYVTSGEKVVPAEWVNLAQRRWDQASEDGVRAIGLDVAGGGQDETVAYLRTGQRVRWIDSWDTDDLMESADRAAELCLQYEVGTIFVDRTGLGQGVWSRMVQLSEEGKLPGVTVHGIALQKAPDDDETYNRKQDEVLFSLRWALHPKNPDAVAIDPEDKQLSEELVVRGWYKNDRHRIQCESKRDLKKRGVGSPDRADAVSLLFAPVPEQVGYFIAA